MFFHVGNPFKIHQRYPQSSLSSTPRPGQDHEKSGTMQCLYVPIEGFYHDGLCCSQDKHNTTCISLPVFKPFQGRHEVPFLEHHQGTEKAMRKEQVKLQYIAGWLLSFTCVL